MKLNKKKKLHYDRFRLGLEEASEISWNFLFRQCEISTKS